MSDTPTRAEAEARLTETFLPLMREVKALLAHRDVWREQDGHGGFIRSVDAATEFLTNAACDSLYGPKAETPTPGETK